MAAVLEKMQHHDSPADSTDRFDAPDRSYRVVNRPYAGRLGASQRFSISGTTAQKQDLLQKVPDAAPYLSLKEALNMRPLTDIELWKQAFIEAYATTFFVWATTTPELMMVHIFPDGDGTGYQRFWLSVMFHITLGLVVATLVFATAPLSGGHMNPMVTIGTFLNGLTSLPRAILYVAAQLVGATVAAQLLKAMYGREIEHKIWSGCYVDPAQVTPAQIYALEATAGTFLMYLLYRTALDPHYKHVYGTVGGTILVATSFALVSFLTFPVVPGSTGASLNPARCFGLMTVSGEWTYYYAQWAGSLTAVVIGALVHQVLPAGIREE